MIINKLKQLIINGNKNITIEAEDFNIYKFNQPIFYVHILADTEDEQSELIDTLVYFKEDERNEDFEAAQYYLQEVN